MKNLLVFFILFNLFILKVNAIEINSNKAVLYNLNDDTIIYEKNSDNITQVASLTKIVTAITIIDNVKNLNDIIEVKSNMLTGLNGYAKAGLKVGDKVTYLDLIYALMLPSGADAALTLAISYSNDITTFVQEMNSEIFKIGVKNTHFENPIGIDNENNYSTANDIAIILKYALNNKTFKKVFSSNNYTIPSTNLKLKKTTLSKATAYNLDVSDITGSKTGYTDAAGYCLATTANINGVDYLLVTLNADTTYPYHIKDTVDLYHYYSNNYSYKTIIKKNKVLAKIPIKGSRKKELIITSDDNIAIYLNNSYKVSKLKYKYSGVKNITNKIKLNDKIGHVDVLYDNKKLYTYDIFLKEDIEYYNYLLFLIAAVILCIILKLIYNKTRK